MKLFMTDVDHEDYEIKSNPLSLALTFDCAEDVKNAYHLMADGATILSDFKATPYASAYVSFVDRFGMRWEFMTEQTDK